jgi:hypothetical protein
MKLTLKIFLCITMMSAITHPQQQRTEGSVVEQMAQKEATERVPIPGSHLFRETEKQVRDYMATHPDANQRVERARRTTAWNFSVGDKREWWAITADDDNEYYQVSSTCQKVGDHCYIFVEDSLWEVGGNGRVTQAGVDAIQEAFDESTPADANRGIYELEVETFGPPPNVDVDDRIIILILDIIDGDPDGFYIAGYFNFINEFPDGDPYIGDQRSNFAEIYYMDGDPGNLLTPGGIDDALLTAAHEFQHMIHFAGDESGEDTFVSEGLAEIAEVVCGWDLRGQSRYNNNPNINLFWWTIDGNPLADYQRAARWTLYLWEQIPGDFLFKLTQHDHNSNLGIDGALFQSQSPRRFPDIFTDWIIANYLNDKSVDSKWGYDYNLVPLGQPLPLNTHYTPTDGAESSSVQKLGVEYVTFMSGSVDSVLFTGPSDIKIKAIKIGSSTVDDVSIGTAYPTPGLQDGSYDEITFALYVNDFYSFSDNFDYEYTGYGGNGGSVTVEQVFDDGSGDGALSLTTGDSISIQFDGLEGAKLDSIKIAFLNAGSMQMGIWRFTGSYGTSPFGAPLVQERMITSNSASAEPFPDPFENWVTIDLSGDEIDASDDFIVSLLVGTDPVIPGVMASGEPDNGVYRSRTWLQSQGGGWWILTTNEGTDTWNYMIRAYLCASGCTIEVGPESIGTVPSAYRLSENFPNPFNPSTTFTYDITEPGEVSFAIYDLIGRLVYEEKRNHLPGQYSLRWNGIDSFERKVGSGVYLLRMHVNEFSATRKMVLLK